MITANPKGSAFTFITTKPHRESDQYSWEVELSLESHPLLRDHRILRNTVLPGSAYIEMALAAAQRIYGRVPTRLHNVSFRAPVVLPEDGAQAVGLCLSLNPAGELQFYELRARDGRDQSSAPALPRASLVVAQPSDNNVDSPQAVNLDQILSRCPREIPREDFYAELRNNGNHYGPAFQAIKRLWRGSGEALGALSVPEFVQAELNHYYFHPAVLDTAIQALSAADQRAGPFALVSAQEVRIIQPRTNLSWVHAEAGPHRFEDSVEGSVSLLGRNGCPAIQLLGVRLKYLGPEEEAAVPSLARDETIAITATFVAEPVERAISYWMGRLSAPCAVRFAPYNQLFQQLLDPDSLISKNRAGLNVILIRLEDLLGRALPGYAGVAGKERYLAGQLRHRLPNGLEIAHLYQYETDYLYQEITTEHTYLSHGVTLADGDCIVDIGANIGLFTLDVLTHCKDARIYAFEPARRLFDILNVNMSLYGEGVKTFDCALSNREGESLFRFYKNSSVFSGLYADDKRDGAIITALIRNILREQSPRDTGAWDEFTDELAEGRLEHECYTVRLRRLSDVIREEHIGRIDLLKIDAERSESDILAGIDEEHWSKIRQIVVEGHDDESVGRICSLLRRKHFNVVVTEKEL